MMRRRALKGESPSRQIFPKVTGSFFHVLLLHLESVPQINVHILTLVEVQFTIAIDGIKFTPRENVLFSPFLPT